MSKWVWYWTFKDEENLTNCGCLSVQQTPLYKRGHIVSFIIKRQVQPYGGYVHLSFGRSSFLLQARLFWHVREEIRVTFIRNTFRVYLEWETQGFNFNNIYLVHPLFICVIYIYIYIYIGCLKRMVRFQKLTRNLFLTLHGQNVHLQQWQLSEIFVH
jgi:RsiW-degrading membrane proteinase PrsW (M82 family)